MKKQSIKVFLLMFVFSICTTVVEGQIGGGGSVKADIAKRVKKSVVDGEALKSMKSLAVISCWGVDWHARGTAGPGTIGYGETRNLHKSWMPHIFASFTPRLESGLSAIFQETGQEVKPLSYAQENSDYVSFEPVQTEPKKGRGLLHGSLGNFKFIDDSEEDIAAASKSLDVDGVITLRYMIWPAPVPTKKNQMKIWMKIFTKDGTLVWFGKMYSEFKAAPPKFRKFENFEVFLPESENEALENLGILYEKSFNKIK